MAARLKVGLVGAGFFSQFHIDAWERLPGAQLVGIADHDIAKAEAAGQGCEADIYAGMDEMLALAKLDLVDIAAPPIAHLGLIEAALEAGVPVICQKPFCTSASEASAVVAKAERLGLMLAVHENFRFQPWYREIRRLIDDEVLGDLFQVMFRLRPGDGRGAEAYLSRQPFFQKMERFLVHETAVHFVDVFRYLVGPIGGVTARLRQLNPVISGEDAGYILFDFKGGSTGLFDGNRLADHAAENHRLTMGEMVLEGTKATLRLDGQGRLFLRWFGESQESEHHYGWTDRGFGGDCVFALQSHIYDHLVDGKPLENAASDYLDVLMVEKAIYQSHQNRCYVSLNE